MSQSDPKESAKLSRPELIGMVEGLHFQLAELAKASGFDREELEDPREVLEDTNIRATGADVPSSAEEAEKRYWGMHDADLLRGLVLEATTTGGMPSANNPVLLAVLRRMSLSEGRRCGKCTHKDVCCTYRGIWTLLSVESMPLTEIIPCIPRGIRVPDSLFRAAARHCRMYQR